MEVAIIASLTAILITYVIRDTVLKINSGAVPSKFSEDINNIYQQLKIMREDMYFPKNWAEETTEQAIPEIPEVPDKEWAGTPDNPYTPDLGSEQLHALHAEFDQRIEDLKKELEYEEQQLNYVIDASKGLMFSEDADELAKQLASKVKVEVAE